MDLLGKGEGTVCYASELLEYLYISSVFAEYLKLGNSVLV